MQRRLQPELMDDPDLDPELHHAALAGLRLINAWSGTARRLWRAIRQLARKRHATRLRVLDVACGDGELAFNLAARSHGSGLAVQVDGCDISPVAVQRATDIANSRDVGNASFFVQDALGAPLPGEYDVIYCSLFLHHLTGQQAVTLLGRMHQAARVAVLVDDLVRSRWGYALAWSGCRLLSRSPIVHHDGPVSVQSAFLPHEAVAMARQAGLVDAWAARHWPARYLLTCERP